MMRNEGENTQPVKEGTIKEKIIQISLVIIDLLCIIFIICSISFNNSRMFYTRKDSDAMVGVIGAFGYLFALLSIILLFVILLTSFMAFWNKGCSKGCTPGYCFNFAYCNLLMKIFSFATYCFGFYLYHLYLKGFYNIMKEAYNDFNEEINHYSGDPDDPYWIERKKYLESEIEIVTEKMKFAEPYIKKHLIIGVIAIALILVGIILEIITRCTQKNKNMEEGPINAVGQLSQDSVDTPKENEVNQGMDANQNLLNN